MCDHQKRGQYQAHCSDCAKESVKALTVRVLAMRALGVAKWDGLELVTDPGVLRTAMNKLNGTSEQVDPHGEPAASAG